MSENPKEQITVFEDGSDEAKVLISQCQKNPLVDLNIIKVSEGDVNDLEKYFEKIELPKEAGEDGPIKVWLPYSNTHFSELLQEARNPDGSIARVGLDSRIGKIVHDAKDKSGRYRLVVSCPFQNRDQRHVLFLGIQDGVLDKSVLEPKKEEPETTTEGQSSSG